jgi:hypothetical protein
MRASNPIRALLLGAALAAAPYPAAAENSPEEQAQPAERQAAEPQQDEAMRVVQVTGTRAVPWKSYRTMKAAEQAFHEHRPRLAPQAQFRFAVLPPKGQKLPPKFALRVRTRDGREIPVAVEEGRLFLLPEVPDADDADLVSNVKGGALRIGMLLYTPDAPIESYRLGDLRLGCRIDEVLDKENESLVVRALKYNRCERAVMRALYNGPGGLPTLGASLVFENRRAALEPEEQRGTTFYRVPLHDTSWPDEALVVFDFKAPPQGLSRINRVAFDPKQ